MGLTQLAPNPFVEDELYLTRKKRVLLDLDGVVITYDFYSLIKEYFNVDLPSPIYAYDLADVLGVSPSAIDDMFQDQVWGKPHFIKDALETLKEWEIKYELIIFSNRVRYMTETGLAKWLIQYKIPFHGIDVEGRGQYDYHIDDRPSKLISTESQVKILYEQSWNKGCFDIFRIFARASDWGEVREIVEGKID